VSGRPKIFIASRAGAADFFTALDREVGDLCLAMGEMLIDGAHRDAGGARHLGNREFLVAPPDLVDQGEGEDLIRTHSWIVRVVAEAIARGDLPVPSGAAREA